MRPSLLFAFSILLAYSPLTQAESPKDGSDLFVAAHEKAKLGEKAERDGDFDLALTTLLEADRMFDKVPANQRYVMPAIIKLSKELTASSIAWVEREFAQSGSYRLHANRENAENAKFSLIVVHVLPKTGFVLVSDHP